MKSQDQMPSPPENHLVDAPRWLLLLLLIYAPFAYGCTEDWAIDILEIGMGGVIGLWLTAAVVLKQTPHVHPVCLGCVAVILLQGWWMTLNAHLQYNADLHAFTPAVPLAAWLPGSVDRASTAAMMLRVTTLLGVLCFANDLVAQPEWRNRIWWTVSLTGAAIVFLALLQRITDAPAIFWEGAPIPAAFFGTYVHHGNAASFINLVMPLIAGRTVIAIRSPEAHGARALWLTSLFLCIAAAFVNVSRSGATVSVLLLGGFLFFEGKRLSRRIWLPPTRVLMTYMAAVILFLVGLVMFTGWESPAKKWALLPNQLNAGNPRVLALEACWRMIANGGAWGFGPGAFAIVFPHYTQSLGNEVAGIWRYAHQDYVQTIIEWGWLGMFAPALLFLGGIARCLIASPSDDRSLADNDRLLFVCAGLALAGVALHATVDFPLQIASLQLYAAVYLGLAWGKYSISGTANRLGLFSSPNVIRQTRRPVPIRISANTPRIR